MRAVLLMNPALDRDYVARWLTVFEAASERESGESPLDTFASIVRGLS